MEKEKIRALKHKEKVETEGLIYPNAHHNQP